MKTHKGTLISLLVILCLALLPAGLVSGQDPPPPPAFPPEKPGGSLGSAARHPVQIATAGKGQPVEERIGAGGLEVEAAGDIHAQALPADGFGYTRKAVPVNWLDASGGTLMDFTGADVLNVDLPFAFPFYENSHIAVKLARYGYLTFSPHWAVSSTTQLLSPTEPNNIIAPYWTPVNLAEHGAVYVLAGGVAPERYVVFEWLDVHDDASTGNHFTFEVALFENGNILFQYDVFEYLDFWYYASAGIEDSTGTLGQVSLKYKTKQKSGKAVLFTRPTASVSVKVFPTSYGAFAPIGGPANYPLAVINNGAKGVDVYDVRISSKWPAVAYQADGLTPLVDTDGDRKIDTGPVQPGDSAAIVIQVTAPLTAVVGNSKATSVTFTSSLKTTRKKSVTLTTTIPAAFTQVMAYDYVDQAADVSAANFSPGAGTQRFNVAEHVNGYNPGVARMPSGHAVYTWSQYGCEDQCEQVYYRILDQDGAEVTPPTALDTPTPGRWDFGVFPAAAPNGTIGLTFLRQEQQDDAYLYNVYFVLLDAAGAVLAGPTNITKNTSSAYEVYEPRIVAEANSNYTIAFERDNYSGEPLSDIYVAVYDGEGEQLAAPSAITNDQGYIDGYYSPSLTALSGNRLLVAYHGYRLKGSSWTEYVYYTVFEQGGAVLRPQTGISLGKVNSYGVDGVQMDNGQVLLSWGSFVGNRESVSYAILKDVTYTKAKGPVKLNIKPALTGSYYVSVTRDHEGRGIITWADDWRDYGRHVYYALVGKNGVLLTPPVIFMTSAEMNYLYLTPFGCGNTTSVD